MALHVIVLAAGKGTRMRSELAKVLHVAAGRPLLSWVLDATRPLAADSTVVVVGHQADAVARLVSDVDTVAVQREQRGTGHAASVGLDALDHEPSDVVVVVPGDMPLIRSATMRRLVETHRDAAAAATVVSAVVADPTGYGRIVRDGERVVRIVEERDAAPEERSIREVNTSVYAFDAAPLARALDRVGTDNDQGEAYLTDVIGELTAGGLVVAACVVDEAEAEGVNTVEQLASVARELAAREHTR